MKLLPTDLNGATVALEVIRLNVISLIISVCQECHEVLGSRQVTDSQESHTASVRRVKKNSWHILGQEGNKMTETTGGAYGGSCPYCGNWHTYSYEYCKDQNKRQLQTPNLIIPSYPQDVWIKENGRLRAENADLKATIEAQTELLRQECRDNFRLREALEWIVSMANVWNEKEVALAQKALKEKV